MRTLHQSSHYKKDYQELIADVTAEVYNLAFDAFRRTCDSFSLSGKTGNATNYSTKSVFPGFWRPNHILEEYEERKGRIRSGFSVGYEPTITLKRTGSIYVSGFFALRN